MYCSSCGNKELIGAKFCTNCGVQLKKLEKDDQGNPPKTEPILNKEKRKKKSSAHITLLNWKMSEDELENQVTNYSNLSITHSHRGSSAVLLVVSALINIGLILWGGFSSQAYVDVVIALVLAYFIYAGHKWAIIAAMLFWTFEKGYQLYTNSNILVIIWWAIFMSEFYKAYIVENARRKVTANV